MKYITKTIIVVLLFLGIEIIGQNFAEAAPNMKNSPVNNTKGKTNRKPGAKISQRPKIVRPKGFGTEKTVSRNTPATKTVRNTSSGHSISRPIPKNQKPALGYSKTVPMKTSQTERSLPSTNDKRKGMQRERGTSSTSHSPTDLKYGLKEGLKYGLKYGEKK